MILHWDIGGKANNNWSYVLGYVAGWWYTYPSQKNEFVSWDYEFPNIWKNKIHVPNHQLDKITNILFSHGRTRFQQYQIISLT